MAFKPMRSYLKNKLSDSEELTKIQNKLFKFLDQNKDVDHYLDDYCRKRWWVGILFGVLLSILFLEFVFVALMIIDPGIINHWVSQFAVNHTATAPVVQQPIHNPWVR
jgi:hypothetical protein